MLRSLLVLTLLVGCAVDEPALGETDDAITSSNKLASNKLASNKLASNKLASNSLAASALVSQTGLLATADGREVLSYIISCALPAGTTVTLGGYPFAGSIGLAPEWATGVPTASNRRWVTACVLARTNYYGIAVALSMRGDNPALAAGLFEGVQYSYTEAAFFGDLFDSAGPTEYACDALDKALPLSPLASTTSLRQCAVSANGATTACGFSFEGKCGLLDLDLQPDCSGLALPALGGYYSNCRTGHAITAPTLHEVITVYLAGL